MSTIKTVFIQFVIWGMALFLSLVYSPYVAVAVQKAPPWLLMALTFVIFIYLTFNTGKNLFICIKNRFKIKVEIVKALLWLLVYSLVVMVPTSSCRFHFDFLRSFIPTLFVSILTIISIFGLVQLICYKKKLDQRRYVRVAVLFLLFLAYLPTLVDDDPIEDDWSEEDLVFTSSDIQKSYDDLSYFTRDGYDDPKLRLKEFEWTAKKSPEDIYEKIIENEDNIRKSWRANQEKIQQFLKLDNYEGITDIKAGEKLCFTSPVLSLTAVRNIAFLCNYYAILEAKQGRVDKALMILGRVNSICNKGLKYSSGLVNSMIWIALCRVNINALKQLFGLSNFTKLHAKALVNSLSPFKDEGVFERVMKTEYVFMKNIITEMSEGTLDVDEVLPGRQLLMRSMFFKKNKTLKAFRKLYEDGIAKAKLVSQGGKVERTEIDINVDPSNLVGWVLAQIAFPSVSKNAETLLVTRIKSEILHQLVSDKAEIKMSYIDPYTGNPYQKSEDGFYHSAGVDRKYFTKDDITLQ